MFNLSTEKTNEIVKNKKYFEFNIFVKLIKFIIFQNILILTNLIYYFRIFCIFNSVVM